MSTAIAPKVLRSVAPMATRTVSAKLLAKLLQHAPPEVLADVLTVHTGVTCLCDEVGENFA